MDDSDLTSFDSRKKPRRRGHESPGPPVPVMRAPVERHCSPDPDNTQGFGRVLKTPNACVKRVCKVAKTRNQAARAASKKPAARAKKSACSKRMPQPGLRKGDIEFPSAPDLQIRGSVAPWQCAERFRDRLQTANIFETPHAKVQMFTEFSGSSCPEACAESISATLSMSFDFVSAGDISQQCRKLIIEARHCLSFSNCSRSRLDI